MRNFAIVKGADPRGIFSLCQSQERAWRSSCVHSACLAYDAHLQSCLSLFGVGCKAFIRGLLKQPSALNNFTCSRMLRALYIYLCGTKPKRLSAIAAQQFCNTQKRCHSSSQARLPECSHQSLCLPPNLWPPFFSCLCLYQSMRTGLCSCLSLLLPMKGLLAGLMCISCIAKIKQAEAVSMPSPLGLLPHHWHTFHFQAPS